eukprot:362569-Chlamydomonas_euryale.AAC.3
MVLGRPMNLPTRKLSGKELLTTGSFKYSGSFFADDGSMSREMGIRNVCALAAFHQLQGVRASPMLSNNVAWMCVAHSFCPFSCTGAKLGRGRGFGLAD